MLQLLIETSTERALVAIVRDNELLFEDQFPFGYSSSTHLLPSIQEGLNTLGLVINDIDCIGVGIGPGSYTGMRIGATAAKTFSYACHKPLVGLPSLKTFLPGADGPFCVLIDAKIGGAYFIAGKREGSAISYFSVPQVVELQNLKHVIGDIPTIVTPGGTPLKKRIEAAGINILDYLWEEKAPDPLHMSAQVREKFIKNEFQTDGRLELLYLRKTQAEIEKNK